MSIFNFSFTLYLFHIGKLNPWLDTKFITLHNYPLLKHCPPILWPQLQTISAQHVYSPISLFFRSSAFCLSFLPSLLHIIYTFNSIICPSLHPLFCHYQPYWPISFLLHLWKKTITNKQKTQIWTIVKSIRIRVAEHCCWKLYTLYNYRLSWLEFHVIWLQADPLHC